MTATDPRLRQLLGTDPPASIAALSKADQERLVEIVAGARKRQSRDLAESFEAALKHVPFPIRGLVRKTLLG
jgi:hypothetical protein